MFDSLRKHMFKICSKCKEPKPIEEFHFKSKKIGKRHSACETCMRRYRTDHYQAHRASTLVKNARRRKRVWAENVRNVKRYLREHPCVDCGESDLLVLEFDHVRGKKRNSISQILRSWLWSTVLLEIKKCDVRCANCHRRATIRRAKQIRSTW